MCCGDDGGGVVSLACGRGLIFRDAESDYWSFPGHAQTQNNINMAIVTTAPICRLPRGFPSEYSLKHNATLCYGAYYVWIISDLGRGLGV